ncbi:MAG: LapA family protein [Gammaproteobacteria bacterium]|nr:LapA family protein [Gammaproteobacteria bacterium]MCD8542735.1 LapA family protein [Gammaproteobacteria bacterium]
MMKILRYVTALFVVISGVSFSLLNATDVDINYFIGSATLPVSFLVIISFALGAIMSLLLTTLWVLRKKLTIYQLKRRIVLLEKSHS